MFERITTEAIGTERQLLVHDTRGAHLVSIRPTVRARIAGVLRQRRPLSAARPAVRALSTPRHTAPAL